MEDKKKIHESSSLFLDWRPAWSACPVLGAIPKFAATLRYTQSDDSGPVCVKMDMAAGHFSASDRYKYYKDLAFDYAFLLDQVGLADK